MNVLVVQGSDFESGGGVETFVSELIYNTHMLDVKFTLLYPTQESSQYRNNTVNGRIRYFPVKVPFSMRSNLLKHLDLIIFNISILFLGKKFYDDFNAIHINGVSGALISIRFPNRSLFTIHGNAMQSFIEQRKIYRRSQLILNFLNSMLYFSLELLASMFSVTVVSVSPNSKEMFERYVKREISVIPIGITSKYKVKNVRREIEKKYNLKEGSFVCLWVGRNPQRKGLNIAVKSLLGEEKAYLFVVGISYISVPLNSQNILYLGNIDSDELFNLYASLDLLIFPSSYEAMSYTIIEALSMGLPVMAFRKKFITDIVGNDYPLLCDNEDDFRSKIEEIMNWPKENRDNLRALSFSISKNFSSDIMAKKYYALYREICDDKQ